MRRMSSSRSSQDSGPQADALFLDYPRMVLDGVVPANLYIRQLCGMVMEELQQADVHFDNATFGKIVKLTDGFFKHPNGAPFVLEPWQRFLFGCFYCIKYTNGKRKYTEVYLEIPRKNGKSAVASLFALLSALLPHPHDTEPPSVVFAANSKEQAGRCMEFAQGVVKATDKGGKYFSVPKAAYPWRTALSSTVTNGVIKCVSSDSSKLDGMNLSFFVIDEYHEAKTNSLYSVLKESQGQRQEPSCAIITTAGFNTQGPCKKYRDACVEILDGKVKSESRLIFIYTLDEGEDWKTAIETGAVRKAHPNYDISVRPEWLKEQVETAIREADRQLSVKVKLFNLWADSDDCWIEDETVKRRMQEAKQLELSMARMAGRRCWVGVDLSSTNDLTAVSFLFATDAKLETDWLDTDTKQVQVVGQEPTYSFITYYFLPEATLYNRTRSVVWNQFHEAGHMQVTTGNVVNYRHVVQFIDDLVREHGLQVVKFLYDAYNATDWASMMTELSYTLIPHKQGLMSFSPPTKQLQKLMVGDGERVLIEPNAVTRLCFRNVKLKTDWNGNVKPDKATAANKIDGVISMIQALSGFMHDRKEAAEGGGFYIEVV